MTAHNYWLQLTIEARQDYYSRLDALDKAREKLHRLDDLPEPWQSAITPRVDGDSTISLVLCVETPAAAAPLIEWLEDRFGAFVHCSRDASTVVYEQAGLRLVLGPTRCERVQVGTAPVMELRCPGWAGEEDE